MTFRYPCGVSNLTLRRARNSGPVITISSRGWQHIREARRDLNAKMDKPLFLGTVRALMLTDALTQYGIEEYFYRLQTMLDYRRVLEVVTTRSSPEEIFSVRSENNVSLGYEVDDTITSLKNTGRLVTYTVSDVQNFIYARRSFVVVNMDAVDGRLTYTGYTVIKDSHYAGFIPLDKAGGLIWLLGATLSVSAPCRPNHISATVEVKARISRCTRSSNGQVIFDINMDFFASSCIHKHHRGRNQTK